MTKTRRAKILAQIEALGFHAFHYDCDDDLVKVSAEYGDEAADYWGEFRGKNYPWIHPKLEALAARHKCFWEWENPGCIGLYDI